MNSVKNLMIIAVLGAVGYGVYVSLQRNNVDPAPMTAQKLGGPLALTSSEGQSTGVSSSLGDAAPRLAPSLPQNTAAGVSPATAPGLSRSPATTAAAGATLGQPTPNPSFPPLLPTNPPPPPGGQPTPPMGGQPTPPMGEIPPASAVANLTPPIPPAAAGPSRDQSAAVAPVDDAVQAKFVAFMDQVQKKLNEGKLAEAHLALTVLYDDPQSSAEHVKQIIPLLDQLAGTVIYSRRHFLEPPYVAQPGETIEKVAQKYNVPWQLLARINGLMPPAAANTYEATKDQPLPAGMELKVVRGPVSAVVRLDKKELTLRVPGRDGPLFAGRFPIGVGRDQPKLDGAYTVQNKAFNPVYFGPDGLAVQAGDPRNPLRDAWIGLTDRIGIHGTADPQAVGREDNRGTICVGQRDLQDLYGILSVGSRVTVLR